MAGLFAAICSACVTNDVGVRRSVGRTGSGTAAASPAMVVIGRSWNSPVERFAPLDTSVIHRSRLTESDADDVRQNALLRLVEHLEGIREPRALPGWIVTTARNEALRVLSARRRVELVDPRIDDRLDTLDNEDLGTNLLLAETTAGGSHRTRGTPL